METAKPKRKWITKAMWNALQDDRDGWKDLFDEELMKNNALRQEVADAVTRAECSENSLKDVHSSYRELDGKYKALTTQLLDAQADLLAANAAIEQLKKSWWKRFQDWIFGNTTKTIHVVPYQ